MQSFWSGKGWRNRLLLPVSWLFGVLSGLRRWLYQQSVLSSGHPGVPVVIVGNLTAGGSGKTPFVIWLVQWLQEQGYQPGVVSRGYGRKDKGSHVLNPDSTAAQAGDEPLLVCAKTGAPVVVDSDRLQACKTLRAHYPDVNILVADDGLQHYRLQRDLELVLADATGLFGNGWLLPAGPLREPLARLNEADALILSQRDERGDNATQAGKTDPGISASRIPVFCVRHQPGVFRNLRDPEIVVDAAYFSGKIVDAVAGIARPEVFFDALERNGLKIQRHAFADHHAYAPGELNPQAAVVMTEKDAVKCRKLAGADWWVRTLELTPDAALENWLAQTLPTLNRQKTHGQ